MRPELEINALRIVGILLSLVTSGCGSSAPTGSSAGGGAGLDVSPGACPDAGMATSTASCVPLKTRVFTRDLVPLFNSCAGEVCHGFGARGIAEQVGVPSVECCGELQMIEPGHPERSYVLQKLRGTNVCSGAQMPLGQSPFSADDLQIVSDWICQGAITSP